MIKSKISLKKLSNQNKTDNIILKRLVAGILAQDIKKVKEILDKIPEQNDYNISNLFSTAVSTGNHELVKILFEKMPQIKVGYFNSLLAMTAGQNDTYLLDFLSQEYKKRTNNNIEINDLFLILSSAGGNLEQFKIEFEKCIKNQTRIRWQLVLDASAKNAHIEIFNFAFEQITTDDVLGWVDIVANAAESGNITMFENTLKKFKGNFRQTKEWLPIIASSAKSGNVEMFYHILDSATNSNLAKVLRLDWVRISGSALGSNNQEMINAIFEIMPDKLDMLKGAIKTENQKKIIIVFDKFIESFDQIFEKTLPSKQSELLKNITSLITEIPQHIDNLMVFKILHNFSKKIKDNPKINSLEVALDEDRHDSVNTVSAIFRTNKTLQATINEMIDNLQPSSAVEIASADQISRLPKELQKEIVEFASR